jgi:hypothetical protein
MAQAFCRRECTEERCLVRKMMEVMESSINAHPVELLAGEARFRSKVEQSRRTTSLLVHVLVLPVLDR